MAALDAFERIVRLSPPSKKAEADSLLHPFDVRNIYPGFPEKIRQLFDDGHCAEATFAAFKFVEKLVQRHSGKSESGYKLMMNAFSKDNPLIKLTPLLTVSEQDEQEGFRFMFAGGAVGIRNPRGHEVAMTDDPDVCLDHLSFSSLLIRRMEEAGYK
jgi:uncharacterized protein (TIGR02391 family)